MRPPSDDGPAFGITEAIEAIAALPLEHLEESSGELHRRVADALRRIGEEHADANAPGDRTARQEVAGLVALIEQAAAALAAVAAGGTPAQVRSDRHPVATAAVMYAAPTIAALLQRLEQNRRMLTSVARHMESRLDEAHPTAWGHVAIRYAYVDAAVTEPARCAQLLEQRALELEAAEWQRIQREARGRST